MNFNDSQNDKRVGSKTAGRKSNMAGEEVTHRRDMDRTAMDSAQRAQDRMNKNANTNSSNTIFSK